MPANEEDEDGSAAALRTLDQMRQLFVAPELERRRLASQRLPVDLNAFQVIWSAGAGQPPVVRVNDEIRALLKVDVPIREGLTIGAPINLDSSTKIMAVHTCPDEEKYAHFTAMQIDTRWVFSFDFRYQREDARRHLEAAEQFLVAARHAYELKLTRAFLENAHSAIELFVKVELLLFNQISSGRVQHPQVREHASKFIHLQDTHALLQRLADLRLPSRYLVGVLEIDAAEVDAIAGALEPLLEHARTRTASYGPAAQQSAQAVEADGHASS